MSTAATSNDSGAMSAVEAAQHFERFVDPDTGTQEEPEEKTKPAPETEQEPEPEPEQEAEEEGESDDAEEPEAEEEKPTLHTVKVDGEEIQVPLDELIKGYQRTADYTRKTQAVSEQRKATDAELAAVRQEREHYSRMLGTLQSQIQQAEPKIDWARLQVEDPNEWTRQRLMQFDRQTAMQNAESERQRVADLQRQEEDKGIQERVTEEAEKLSSAIPEWKDEAKAKSEKSRLVEFAQTRGYSADELNQVIDHRAVVLLREAMLYHELSQKRANLKPVVPVTTRVSKPGPPATSQVSELTRAKQRLAKTGSVRDAAAIFERML